MLIFSFTVKVYLTMYMPFNKHLLGEIYKQQ